MRRLLTVILMLATLIGYCQGDTLPTLDNILKLRWQTKGLNYTASPLVHDKLIFETFGLTHAYNAETGEKLFFNNRLHQAKIRTLTRDSIVLFSSNDGVALVNILSGRIIYQSKKRITFPWAARPRVIRTPLFFTAVTDSLFAALDVKDGRLVWSKKMKFIYNHPIIIDDLLYVGDSEFLYELQANTGSEKNRYKLGAFKSDPMLVSGIFFVWLKNRGLVAYDLKKKMTIWETKQVRKDSEYKIIVESSKIFSSEDHLRAISIQTGKVLWENERLQSVDSYVLFSTSKYLLCYKVMDDSSELSATEKTTGKLMFEAFTTAYDYENRPKRPLADLEGKHFRFGDKMYKNLLYAVDLQGNIYCFEVSE